MKKEYYVLVFVVLVFIAAIAYKVRENSTVNPTTPTPTATVAITTEAPTPTATPTPTKIVYDIAAPANYDYFFELQPVVNGQQTYIAYPKNIDPENPPKVVVYYHGSGQQITKDFSDQVMKNMRMYGAYFTQRDFAFIASNQHGDNYGKAIAIEDTVKALDYVKSKYPVNPRYFVLGFSMGGMPALRHVITHPNLIDKLALLAPVNGIEGYTNAEKTTLAKIPTTIWHGTKDTNVPYWATELYVKGLAAYKPKLTVVTLTGKIHWDVDTEYMEQIEIFFTKN
jgi:predicted esterase